MSSNVNFDRSSAASAVRHSTPRRAEEIAAELTAFARACPGQTLAAAAILGVLVGGAIYGVLYRR